MTKKSCVSAQSYLLLNAEPDHAEAVASGIKWAEEVIILTAFAKISGMKLIVEHIENALKNGNLFTFVVCLDFYQTDPDLLRKLRTWHKKYGCRFLVGSEDADWTFHPKLFYFRKGDSFRAIVGSANWTGGGLRDNHEMSAMVEGQSTSWGNFIQKWIDGLLSDEELIEGSSFDIQGYSDRRELYKVHDAIAKKRAANAAVIGAAIHTLRDLLDMFRKERPPHDFLTQVDKRKLSRVMADKQMQLIRESNRLSQNEFLALYTPLVSGLWHSGGLHRAKNSIAKNAAQFQRTIQTLPDVSRMSQAAIFEHLRSGFAKVPGAGVNVISEILHAIDNTKFAVMNQNSVAGVRLAGKDSFPRMPTKHLVTGSIYELFCKEADTVRSELGLADFTELDAVFNYAYWESPSDEVDD